MLKKIFILVSCCLQYVVPLPAESAGQDSLWGKIISIRDSLKDSPSAELKLLLNLENGMTRFSYRQDSAHAFLFMQIGLLYSKQDDYVKGVNYYRKAIAMITANINKSWMNSNLLIVSYFRLNIFFDSLNRVSEEMNALDSCISIARRLNTINLYCLAALYKKIEYLFDVGDYINCIDYATICEMLGKQYAHSRGENEYRDGMEYVSSSVLWNINAQLQLKNYNIAENLLSIKLNESKKTGLSYNLGAIYYQLGDIQVVKGNYKKALSYYKEAFIAEHNEGQIVGCKSVLTNIGSFYFKYYKNPDRALFYYKKALALVNKNKQDVKLNLVETLNLLANMGDAYVQKGLYDSAFIYFQLAFDQIRPGIIETDLLYIPFNEFASQKKIGYLTGLLLSKGDAYCQFYKATGKLDAIKKAVRIYKVTDQLLDRIKSEQTDIQSKLFWRSDSRRLYEHAIEACYEYMNTDDAFYFFEKSRAVLLNDQLNEQRWSGEEDILKQTQIRKKILQLKMASDTSDKDSDHFRELQNELLNNRQELNRVVQNIKDKAPLYYQSYIDLKVLTVQDVQKNLLTEHQGLIEIFSGDSAVYIYTIRAKQADFIKLNKYIFDSLSLAYTFLISNPFLLNSRYHDFMQVSNRLYNLIFHNSGLSKGRLIISPDGQYFPFEALVTNNPGEPLNYFLNDYSVTYTYSAKYLLNQYASNSDSSSHVFLGIAPVEFPASMRLTALTGSDQSLSRIQSYFKESNNLVFERATRAAFMDRFSKYKIIQLYTHAEDSGKNGEPVVYFSDSALYLSELIAENKPVTRLIVLSACETGGGKLYNGEGVFSFNRGFAALGIPSSITNLWSVEDKSTYRLTELFYKYLAEEMPIDMALQKAKIKFIETAAKQNQLPYFWAASILVGKNNRLEIRGRGSWKTGAVFILSSGMFFLLAYMAYSAFRRKISHKENFLDFIEPKDWTQKLK